MSPLDMLKAARGLVAREGGWIQGRMAREAPDGPGCMASDQSARCFCAIGAVVSVAHAAGEGYGRAQGEAVRFLSRAAGRYTRGADDPKGGLATWNDTPGRTQSEVVSLFDNAIALAAVTP